jgi:uncharacterized phage infection (PIP) family protein YhgE
MQSRIPVSKPLALVVIGLIIGVSLGLGSGYAVFFPDMVNQRNRSLEERITDLEDSMATLDQKLTGVNQSISVINENLEGILSLADVMNQISSRISTLENGQITLNSQFNNLKNDLTGLETDFTTIQDAWDDLAQSFSDLETAYYSVNTELEDIQGLVRESDGIRLLKTYMANPPVSFEQKISVEIYKVLIEKEQNFENWVILYGENTAKILLQQEVDAIVGGLVWNPTENTEVGGNSYQIKLETYFTMEFSPAKVTVNNMHLEIRATVNIDSGAVSTLQVSLVEIV